MNVQQKRDLLDALEKLHDTAKDGYWHWGICSWLDMDEVGCEVHRLFRAWPDFSGVEAFPVRSHHHSCLGEAYFELPRWTGEYGEARFRLLAFMIDTLREEIRHES